MINEKVVHIKAVKRYQLARCKYIFRMWPRLNRALSLSEKIVSPLLEPGLLTFQPVGGA